MNFIESDFVISSECRQTQFDNRIVWLNDIRDDGFWRVIICSHGLRRNDAGRRSCGKRNRGRLQDGSIRADSRRGRVSVRLVLNRMMSRYAPAVCRRVESRHAIQKIKGRDLDQGPSDHLCNPGVLRATRTPETEE